VRNLHDLVDDLGKASASAVDVSKAQRPTPVEVVSGGENLLAWAQSGLTPPGGPGHRVCRRGAAGGVPLVGAGPAPPAFPAHTATTTLAVDEVGARLSGFLLAQLQVNAGFALALGLGLYFLASPTRCFGRC
jgi:hypothetical protein